MPSGYKAFNNDLPKTEREDQKRRAEEERRKEKEQEKKTKSKIGNQNRL